VLRAVENRVSVARAANGGFILLLDPRGRTVAGPVLAAGTVISGSLPLVEGRTLYSRIGDWVGPGALLGCLALMVWGWKARRSPPGEG
jgi:apolipoprotein N-acyltransferase